MNIEMIQYLQINLLGVVLLLTILVGSTHTSQSIPESGAHFFRAMLICNILILLADCGIYLLRWNAAPSALVLCHFFCVLYFALHPTFGLLWLRYTLQKLYPAFVPSRWMKAAFYLPLLAALAVIVTSPVTGVVYRLSEQNRYMRSPFLPHFMVFSYGYWAISLVLVLHEMLHPSRLRERSAYWTLLLFPLPTVVGNLLQFFFYGLTIVWVCSAFSLLILFINLQSFQLSRDALSGLYNRGQTNKQLLWEISHRQGASDDLFAIMLDVDRFKSINDRFGHLTGDEAIILVAELLRRSFRPSDFIGRFGGDEFFVLGHVHGEDELQALLARLDRNTEQLNQQKHLPYQLTLSAGYALYAPGSVLTLDQIISESDAHMYRVKTGKANGTL